MYVREFYPPEWPHYDHGAYPWNCPPQGGHSRRGGTRHFLVAPDGRAEEVDDESKRRGVLSTLEIEFLT